MKHNFKRIIIGFLILISISVGFSLDTQNYEDSYMEFEYPTTWTFEKVKPFNILEGKIITSNLFYQLDRFTVVSYDLIELQDELDFSNENNMNEYIDDLIIGMLEGFGETKDNSEVYWSKYTNINGQPAVQFEFRIGYYKGTMAIFPESRRLHIFGLNADIDEFNETISEYNSMLETVRVIPVGVVNTETPSTQIPEIGYLDDAVPTNVKSNFEILFYIGLFILLGCILYRYIANKKR
ncbi:MAG: hypothetical protein U9R08_00675 [Nanoarchaeota archaeon]|nr:hypothetical protein [Nanoarchaeota archaeon]